MSQNNRVVAYFEAKGQTHLIKGVIVQNLQLKAFSQYYYELYTDERIDSSVRDAEVKLKADRTASYYRSLFVTPEQCAPDIAPPLPPNHPHQKQIDAQKPYAGIKTLYHTGDPVTMPLEEGPNGLINGVVGYTGLFKNEEVAELKASMDTVTSAFISKIRGRYEVANFPNELRQCQMKGFSLVVSTSLLIPGAHVESGQKGVAGFANKEKTFAQAVSSNSSKKSYNSANSEYPSMFDYY